MMTKQNIYSQKNFRYRNLHIWQYFLIVAFCVLVPLGTFNNFYASAAISSEAAIVVNEFPIDNQLYPRVLASNLATVAISGTADSSFAEVVLSVYRDDVLWDTINQPIDSTLSYTMSLQIPAELASYDFELIANEVNGNQAVLASAANVVAGDIFVINGQSNASSNQYEGSGAGDVSNFVRVFGWWQGENWQSDENWYIAIPDCVDSPGCLGQWGLRFGSNIVNTEQVPVAVINGAVDGRSIDYFQRNDANLADISTNMGRLQTRLTSAKINEHIRSIMWYQGESDGVDYTGHINGLTNLYQIWEEIYPSIEQYYVFQIRSGCDSNQLSVISNAQREFAHQRSNVRVVSTTGLDGHNGCHYAYANGYQQIGDNITRIIRKDLYNQPLQNADAADIVSAIVLNSNTIELAFTADNQLIADSGFEELFKLHNDDDEQIIPIENGVVYSDSIVHLTTSELISSDTNLSISYLSPPGDQNWITNQAGIGILSFLNFPVQSGSIVELAGSGNPLDPTTTTTIPPTTSSCGPLAQEGEDGTPFGRFVVNDDVNASGGQYVGVPDTEFSAASFNKLNMNLSDRIEYCVVVPEEGDYRIRVQIMAPDNLGNSFFVQVDNGPESGILYDIFPTDGTYAADYVSQRGEVEPVIYSLTPGNHIFSFIMREDGARLDSFVLEPTSVEAMTVVVPSAENEITNLVAEETLMQLKPNIFIPFVRR